MGKSQRAGKVPEIGTDGFLTDLRELKQSYRNTYWLLRRSLIDAGEQHPDYKTIKEAISDVNYAIMWLHTGKQPGTRRGIERRSVYQNTVLLDPMIMQSFANPVNSRSGSSLTEDEKKALEEVLEILSPQERECYVMAHGHAIPHQQIARMLKLSEGTVSTYIKRAHEKVSRGWEGTLF